MLQGLKRGFTLHTTKPHTPTNVAWNVYATFEEKRKITEWIVKRHKKGQLIGPFDEFNKPISIVFCSPIFAIPKPNGDIRVINHFSWPKWGINVNSLIPEVYKSVQYASLEDIAEQVLAIGQDGYLWVIDMLDAYYALPIRKTDWQYTGIHWCDCEFILAVLPMGCASACQIYNRFADAILHILRNKIDKNMP